MKHLLLIAVCLVLAGCLTTTKAVFTESNSMVAGDSAALRNYVEAWEKKIGKDGSPRELIEKGHRVIELDDQVVVQEPEGDGGGNYYSVGLWGGRLMACLVHDEKIRAIAERNGVTVEIDRDDKDEKANPVPIKADGSEEALHAFVLDVFRNGTLVCQSPATLR